MEATLYAAMLNDKNVLDLTKMQHKYSAEQVAEFLDILKAQAYTKLPICDFAGLPLCYLENIAKVQMASAKMLLQPMAKERAFGLQAMEEEIHSTLAIENIESSRNSIRRVLDGYAPVNTDEQRIAGIKQGLEFIGDVENKITEENIAYLYQQAVVPYLEQDSLLKSGAKYRHDEVFVMGRDVRHAGLSHKQLPSYMKQFVEYINTEDGMNELNKASAIHYYTAYLHPWFDGNGRMARLLHLWYLVQQGYSATLFVPFSKYINQSKAKYYKAFDTIQRNAGISGVVDISPFLSYCIQNVYSNMSIDLPKPDTTGEFQLALEAGKITEKEADLWNFVLAAYGTGEFSTKQLEKDHGDAAYATIRKFVLKFTDLGLLGQKQYGSRVKYHVK